MFFAFFIERRIVIRSATVSNCASKGFSRSELFEVFAEAVVEQKHRSGNLLLSKMDEISAFGEKLPNQTVLVG